MPEGFGPRFPFEAGFLVAVAVAAYFADLSRLWIVVVVALAWLVVALIEWLAWKEEPRRRDAYGWQPYPDAPAAWPSPPDEAPPDIVVPPAEDADVEDDLTRVIAAEPTIVEAPRRRGLLRRRRSA